MDYIVSIKFKDGLVTPLSCSYKEDRLDSLSKLLFKLNPDVVEVSASHEPKVYTRNGK